ncbi:MAG: hypothetical protein LBT01_04995 [Spirochaetaceae bacterium]|jgi:hypothetical protein|nr:hypothetical protein [Spirochaetaceae bacterium]
MRLKITCIMFIISLFVLHNASSEQALPDIKTQYDTGYFLSAPGNGVLVVIGVASRRRTETEERDAALDDAAFKVSCYMGITGKEIREHRASGTFFGFISAVAPTDIVHDTDYSKYREALVYEETKDVLRTTDAVFVRCTYPVSVMNPIKYIPVITNGKPDWTHAPPTEIAGLLAGVGFAGKQRRLSETIAKSYKNAIVALLTRVSTDMVVRDTDSAGHGALSETLQVSEGALSGFLVLETWIDPKTKSVWTLAVAKGITE